MIFSAQSQLFPYKDNKINIELTNLGEQETLGYFQRKKNNEIFKIGLLLKKNNITDHVAENQQNPSQPETFKEISTEFERVKITEVIVKKNMIKAKVIPYTDNPLKDTERKINFQQFTNQLLMLCQLIKKGLSLENIQIFQTLQQKITLSTDQDEKIEQINKLLFQIAYEISPLTKYFKDKQNILLQQMIETQSLITRLTLVFHKAQQIVSILDITNSGFIAATEQMMRMNILMKARIASDFIQQNYINQNANQDTSESIISSHDQSQFHPQMSSFNKTKSQQEQIKTFKKQLVQIENKADREKIKKEIERFANLDKSNIEYYKLQTYLEDVFAVPWQKETDPYWNISYTKDTLQSELYGLDEVKKRIVELIAINKLNNDSNGDKQGQSKEDSNLNSSKDNSGFKKGFAILLNGPPGVGKTSIAKAIAKALKRECRLISMAGISDSHYLKGHKRTYVDSQPGIFVKELIKSKVKNPVLILDEIDKLGRKSYGGSDPAYCLLEILNPDENKNFLDHYMDINIDFSKVLFILTSNSTSDILDTLKDRLEIINIPAYIIKEKIEIAKKYLLPKILSNNGLKENNIEVDDQTILEIIKGWSFNEGGVRELARCLEKISRKQALNIIKIFEQKHDEEDDQQQDINTILEENESKRTDELNKIQYSNILNLTEKQQSSSLIQKLEGYLGPADLEFFADQSKEQYFSQVGQTNILSVSGFIGSVLKLECAYDFSNPSSKGNITSTGNLQNILKESLNIAKLNCLRFLSMEQIKNLSEQNLHLHFLSSSSPKDGPSAGTAITTALLSLILNKKLPKNLAQTGEISLNGDVLGIGGIQEKLIASKALNIKNIILPFENKGIILSLSKLLLNDLQIFLVKNYKEIYEIIFSEKKDLANTIIIKNGEIVKDKTNYQFSLI